METMFVDGLSETRVSSSPLYTQVLTLKYPPLLYPYCLLLPTLPIQFRTWLNASSSAGDVCSQHGLQDTCCFALEKPIVTKKVIENVGLYQVDLRPFQELVKAVRALLN
jgi:hypothetical protein